MLQRQTIHQRVYRRIIPITGRHVPIGWITFSIFLTFLASSVFHSPGLSQVALLLTTFGLFITLLNGLFQGAISTVDLSTLLAKARERSMYDLLCLLPAGAPAFNWSMCAVYIQRSRIFVHLSSEVVWIVRFLFSIMVVLSVSRPSAQLWEGPLIALVQIVLLCGAFYLDDLQSLILCSLVGQLSPTYARNPADARLYALFGYFFLQVLTYLLTFLMAFTFLPALYTHLGVLGVTAYIMQPLFALGLFYVIRETTIYILWHVLLHRLDIPPADFQQSLMY